MMHNERDVLLAAEAVVLKGILAKRDKGIFSYVSDSYDFFGLITKILPKLKTEVMARNGKLVIRPDSGDPVKILCGDVEIVEVNDNWPVELVDAYAKDYLEYQVERQTSHGERGVDEIRGLFRKDGKIFEVVADIEWGRYDKQYYYIEGSKVISYKEYLPSASEKGAVEVLWEIFGGTVNSKGYKELDSHIGLIYGDSITLERAQQICEQLEKKGFASTNVVLGIGSYTYQYVTRDTFGMAVKSTYGEIEGKGIEIFKDPKTDSGNFKKSLKGLLKVYKDSEGKITCKDQCTLEEAEEGLLKEVFKDGKIIREYSLADIRRTIND